MLVPSVSPPKISPLVAAYSFLFTGAFFLIAGSAFVYSVINPPHTDAAVLGMGHPALPRSFKHPLEITVANNGTVYLKDAVLTGISGQTITATISWGSSVFAWTIQMSPKTHFVGQDGKNITQTDFAAGDYISVSGKLNTNAIEPTIDALSIQKN